MEDTTVSSSPASPTEGDNLCEIDVTKVALDSVTLLISLCGLVGNGAFLCLLRLKACNAGIVILASIDFLFLLFTVSSTLLFLVEDVSCSPIIPQGYLRFLLVLSVGLCYGELFILMFRSNIPYTYKLKKLCKLCCHCSLPKGLLLVVFFVLYIALLFLIVFSPAVPNVCLSHQQQHCQAALISMYAIILLLCAAPVVIPSTIDFIKAKRGSRKKQPKRRNIIISLILLFILLLSICNFLQQLGYIVLSPQVFFLLNSIHSSIKPFIYFLAGRCWSPCALSSLRLSLQRVFDEQEEQTAPSNDTTIDTGV